jgi:2-C-methyl-D-erythritol 4-phosphate cytidylyltransferase
MTPVPPAEKVGAVIPAAGGGERLPGPVAKQFRELGGVPVLHHTLSRISRDGLISCIVLALPPAELSSIELPDGLSMPVFLVAGGSERQHSVANGLAALPPMVEWVVVHDGARPLLPRGLIETCLLAAQETGASIAALPMTDTVKRDDGREFVRETVPRNELWLAQTPQVFRRDLLEQALSMASDKALEGTDESALLEALGIRVKLVNGSKFNFKITSPEDLVLAEACLARQEKAGTAFLSPGGRN